MERIMSWSQKSRSVIYEALSDIITDSDAVEEFLSHFPARDLDEPVTKEFHRAETASLRVEMADSAAQLRAEQASSAAQLRAETAALRTEMHVGFAELRAEMHRGFQRTTLSLAALMVSMTGVVVAAVTVSG
jgi:hypothetical protein